MTNKRKKEKVNNNCIRCAYFVKHYANLYGTFYLVSGCQHCINENMSEGQKKKRMNNNAKCEHWQKEELQIDQRREHIENTLLITAEKLIEIAQILQEDNEMKKDKLKEKGSVDTDKQR